MVLFLHANAQHSKPKVASRCRHAANIAFDLFNIFLYMIARKVRKCPLSPFVTSNVVLSCLVRMADILARLVQKADSLSALQLTGALLSNTPTPPPHSSLPPPPPLFGPLCRPCRAIAQKELPLGGTSNFWGKDARHTNSRIWCCLGCWEIKFWIFAYSMISFRASSVYTNRK